MTQLSDTKWVDVSEFDENVNLFRHDPTSQPSTSQYRSVVVCQRASKVGANKTSPSDCLIAPPPRRVAVGSIVKP